MKLKAMAMVLVSVAALGACKKKPKEGKAPPEPGSASNAMAGTGAASGSGSAMQPTEPPKEAKLEGKGLADRYVECAGFMSGGKWDDFANKCLAKDYKGHEADMGDITGADAVVTMMKDQAAAFPDTKISPQLVLVNGRNILAVSMISGTHTAPLKTPMGEMPPTNKKMGILMFHRLAISDENRATEEWAWSDPSTFMGQLGAMPKDVPPMRPALEKGWDGAPIVVVAADDAKEKANLEAVTKANKAFADKKLADSMAAYADDAVESDQADGADRKGKKAIQAGAEVFWKAFPDLKIEAKDTYAAGDYVVQTGTFSGTNTGPLGPMKPTKKAVTGSYAEVFKLKDGKITEVWRFRNGMAMAMQMGLMPEPGKGGEAPKAGSGDAPKGSGDAPKKEEVKKDDAKKGG